MHDLFGNQTTIDVDLFYVVEKTKSGSPVVRVLKDDEAAKMKADEKTKDKVKQNRFSFQQLSWESSNNLLLKATEYNFQKNESEISWTKYRDFRLKVLLIGWDLKDVAGQPIPLTEAAINSLQQPIALALLERYDEAISVDRDEQKKT